MIRKSEALSKYQTYEALVSTQKSLSIKLLHSDNGGEYTSNAFKRHCAGKGTLQEFTAPGSPHQNGGAERFNRTISEKVFAMLEASGLPPKWWAEALMYAVLLYNITLSNGLVPWTLWHGQKPNISNLHTWGCIVWALDRLAYKLASKGRECRLLGLDGRDSFRLLDLATLRIIHS